MEPKAATAPAGSPVITEPVVAAREVNASQSDGGRLLLGAICGQAQAVMSIAQSLAGTDYYTNPFSDDHDADDVNPTDIPQAQLELMSAMKDSVKNLSAMTNMLWNAENAPAESGSGDEMGENAPVITITGPLSSGVIAVQESGVPTAVVFTEATTGSRVTKGEVSGTMIQPGFNVPKNRFYAPTALREAVDKKLWVGRQMYWDHSSKSEKSDRPERSVRDLAAVIKETWLESDGSIGYKATLADPQMESKLTYMQEHGILGAMGVSINAAGSGKPETIEGTPTFLVEHFVEAYTTDFVTTPGAGGSVNLLESAAQLPAQTGAEEMDEKAVQALMESFKGIVAEAVKPISDGQTALTSRLDKVETQAKIGTMIESSALPPTGKKMLVTRFAEATTVEGVKEAIEEQLAYVAEIKGDKTVVTTTENAAPRKLGANPVHGMGNKGDAEVPHRTLKDFSESRAAALFGGKERTEKLLESMR